MATTVTNIGVLLLGELQSLCTEARRRHPDIKEAAERVIVILRGIKTTSTEEIAHELSKSDEVLRPFALACHSSNHRLVSTAMHCLQQLVSRQAIAPTGIRETLTTLTHVSAQGAVDMQVKVLQMVLPLVTTYGDSVSGETLVEAFALCLALQRSRDPVVSNTAAAILRQVVVAVFDRVAAEDGEDEGDLTRKGAKDAYYVLQDLCLMAADAEPIFIRAEHTVDKRLVLELIESVLMNHWRVVAGHSAMAQTLRDKLTPFIVNFFAERASFPLAVRGIRIAWLFVRHLHGNFTAECEIILSVFSRLLAPDASSSGRRVSMSAKSGAGFPVFYRVLALEVVRDLLESASLLHRLYTLYDGRVVEEGSDEDCHVIIDLISAVCRVVTERKDLIRSMPNQHERALAAAGDGGSADALGPQIGASTCRMRIEMYKLLDKQEPPSVPDTYMFYLATAAVVGLSEGVVGDILPRCTERLTCQFLHSGGRRSVEVSVLGSVIGEPGAVGGLVRHAWTAIYSVYEFVAGVRLDDPLFARMLESARQLVETAGALDLGEGRDALLALLCRGCLPTTWELGPSPRQVQCVRVLIGCALYLASVLGPSWLMVLATVQQVEECMSQSRSRFQSTPVLDDTHASDLGLVRDEFARLLAFVRARDEAVLWVIRGLCVLGSDLSGVDIQFDGAEDMRRLRVLALDSTPGIPLRANTGALDRPTFAVEEMRGFAVSNIDLLMSAAPESIGLRAWTAIIDHLLATATSAQAVPGLRTQACEAVADVVLAAMDLVARADTLSAEFQAMAESGEAQIRILRPLYLMMMGEQHSAVRKLTLDTLYRVLQASGHSVSAAWDVVFDIIQSIALDQDDSGVLMRCVFPCLQLICTDYLADLSPGCLRRCIGALLVQFGGQQQDLNIALTAIGQAWALCDYFHGMEIADSLDACELVSARVEPAGDMLFDELWREDLIPGSKRSQQVLWLLVLHALAQLGRDSRSEVRLGGIQTLFRAVDMHGPSSFDRWVWDGAMWAVILPLSQDALRQRAKKLKVVEEEELPTLDNGSGMVAEDPRRLLRKQWDETVAATMLGTARAWSYEGVRSIGKPDETWFRVWALTRDMLVDDRECLTRDCVAGALASAKTLVLLTGESGMSWRTAWDSWIAMGMGVTQVPPVSDGDDDVVVGQEVLCALLELCPTLIAGLLSSLGFGVDDCDALLGALRQMLVFVDAPIYSSDSALVTRLQGLVLDALALALGGSDVAALVVGELAMLAVLPLVLKQRGDNVPLGESAVVGATERVFFGELRLAERIDVVGGQKRGRSSRRMVAPTFEALGRAAVGRLGAALYDDEAALALRVLESGAWLNSVVAMGVHLVQSAGDTESWFVRVVPVAMNRLPPGPALDEAWMAVGSVVSLALRSGDTRTRLGVLGAVAESSIASGTCPREYWDQLLGAIEGGVGDSGLAVACVGWLERLCSIECSVPEWVAISAAQRLVGQTRLIVDTFVADRALLGRKSPLPLQRSLLLRRVLQGLALLKCRGPKGSSSHIVAVFGSLVGLVAESIASDYELARALQMCLGRKQSFNDDDSLSLSKQYPPVKRRDSTCSSLGLMSPPPLPLPQSNNSGAGRSLSIQSLLNSNTPALTLGDHEEHGQAPAGSGGGGQAADAGQTHYLEYSRHYPPPPPPPLLPPMGRMVLNTTGNYYSQGQSSYEHGYTVPPDVPRWAPAMRAPAVTTAPMDKWQPGMRVPSQRTTTGNPMQIPADHPLSSPQGQFSYQRSVSFNATAHPTARIGSDQRVARTAYDSAVAEARYRPYPEIPQMTLVVQPGSDHIGDPPDQTPMATGKRGTEAMRRKRRTQACEYCHLKKIKCEGDGVRCNNCIKNDVQCTWGQKRKRGPKPKASLPTISLSISQAPKPSVAGGEESDGETGLDQSQSPGSEERGESLRAPRMEADMLAFFSDDVVDRETREAVKYYFDFFYPLCPMFHPSMFIRRVVQGDVDPLLIDAMKAASAGVVSRITGRTIDGAALARSVKQRILEKIEQPNVDYVRVLVIMTLMAGSQGEMMSYNSLICLAASLVVRLGWHKIDLYKRAAPKTWEDWVSLEVRRRVFWLVYQTDSYQAMLTGRPMSIAEDSVYVSAPCSDYEWDVVTAVAMPPIPSASQPLASVSRATPPAAGSLKNNNRSSRSSSASATSVVQSLRVDQHAIVATGAFSYSFMALCELTAIIARINTFLCDAKSGRLSGSSLHHVPSQTMMGRDGPFPAVDFLGPAPVTGSLVHPVERTVSLLSEYPAFVELDERLEEWKRNLLLPEELRDDAMAAADITYFGNADHRRFMMRVRYFCLHCYYVPITLFLHQSNRPSFFTEYEHPLEERLARRPTPPGDDEEGVTDAALRQMLSAAFASTWNEGLLAYDVDERSWRVCLLAAHGLSEHLERNSDFPLERFDQVIPFCIFMSISVLIRQVRMCSRLLEAAAATSTAQNGSRTGANEARRQLAAKGGYMSVTADRTRCIKHVKQQWATLRKLGSMWNIDGMEILLKSMQIDQVANAADMFSGMSL
ncbi:Endocytosis and vacuole integrity protein [Coemansia sp. RSA 2050]|nr:Endocytosis and vacuole integrity protein [Coemansia sp. RSA 2050]